MLATPLPSREAFFLSSQPFVSLYSREGSRSALTDTYSRKTKSSCWQRAAGFWNVTCSFNKCSCFSFSSFSISFSSSFFFLSIITFMSYTWKCNAVLMLPILFQVSNPFSELFFQFSAGDSLLCKLLCFPHLLSRPLFLKLGFPAADILVHFLLEHYLKLDR